MNDKQKSLLITIPAYNEAETIELTIKNIRVNYQAIRKLGVAPQILVIDDGSSDDTAKRAERAGADKVIRNKKNMKLGATVWRSLVYGRNAGFDLLVKIDADLQHDPCDLASLITPIIEGQANIVYGNRFELISYKMPFMRRMGNKVFTGLMNKLTNWVIKDSQPGIFAVDRNYLKVAHLPGSYNYTQQLLLDGYHKGMMFDQVSVKFNQRKIGASFVGLSYPFRVLPQLLLVLVSIRPLSVFGPIAAFFLGLASIDFLIEVFIWFSGNSEKPVKNVNFVLGTGLLGMQALFFGLLSELVVRSKK